MGCQIYGQPIFFWLFGDLLQRKSENDEQNEQIELYAPAMLCKLDLASHLEVQTCSNKNHEKIQGVFLFRGLLGLFEQHIQDNIMYKDAAGSSGSSPTSPEPCTHQTLNTSRGPQKGLEGGEKRSV